jgi:hypothetical protein
MKKVLFVAMLFTSTAAFSQGFQFGVKGGVNISNYTGGNFESDGLIGFHVGGLFNFMVGKAFSIQPEVLFSSQGAKYNNAGNTSNLKVSYVNVPVMAKLKFGKVYLEAGPQVGFRAGQDANNGNQTINNFAKNLDLSLGAGIGYHTPSGFGVGARYMAGLSKVGDFQVSPGNPINPDFKNSVVQLSVFYTLFNNK